MKYTHNSNRTYSFYDSTQQIPDNSESILVSSTHRDNIVIIDKIVNTPYQSQPAQIEEIDPRYEKYIEEEALYAAVDAAMKYPYFGGHVIFKDTLDEFTDEWTIGTNQWKGTNYYAEIRIMIEVFTKLEAISYTKPYGKLIIITDNLKLQRVLLKSNLTYTDMAHDAGALLNKIVKIRKELTMEIEVRHV